MSADKQSAGRHRYPGRKSPGGRGSGRALSGSRDDIELTASIYSYSMSRGIFAGLSLEGAVISSNSGSNRLYWQKNSVLRKSSTNEPIPRDHRFSGRDFRRHGIMKTGSLWLPSLFFRLFFLQFGPRISKGHRAVKDEAALSSVGIHAEIPVRSNWKRSKELHRLHARFHSGIDTNLQGIGVEVFP